MKKIICTLLFLLFSFILCQAELNYWFDSRGYAHIRGITSTRFSEVLITTDTHITKNLTVDGWSNFKGTSTTVQKLIFSDYTFLISTSGLGGAGVTNVTATLPLSSTGGATPNISIDLSNIATSTHTHAGVYEPADSTIMKEGENNSLLNNNSNYITTGSVTFSNLQNNGSVGNNNNQVAIGTHTHTLFGNIQVDKIIFSTNFIDTTTVAGQARMLGITSNFILYLSTGVGLEWVKIGEQ